MGCGGAVSGRQFARIYPGIRADVVECEPGVIALARQFFALDAIPGVTVHIADGAKFIARRAGDLGRRGDRRLRRGRTRRGIFRTELCAAKPAPRVSRRVCTMASQSPPSSVDYSTTRMFTVASVGNDEPKRGQSRPECCRQRADFGALSCVGDVRASVHHDGGAQAVALPEIGSFVVPRF